MPSVEGNGFSVRGSFGKPPLPDCRAQPVTGVIAVSALEVFERQFSDATASARCPNECEAPRGLTIEFLAFPRHFPHSQSQVSCFRGIVFGRG